MAVPRVHQKSFLAGTLAGAMHRALLWARDMAMIGWAAASALVAGLFLGLISGDPVLVWAGFLTAVALPILWYRPVWAVYTLVAGAVTFETFSLNYPDSLTDQTPFFKSFSSMGSPVSIPVTPAELLMVGGLLVLGLRRMARREKPLEGGTLGWTIAIFSVTVLMGYLYGIGTGGDANVATWEIRPLMYLLPAYLLAFNLARSRRQIRLVFWLFLGAVVFKGILGSWRYLVTLGADLSRISSLSSHNSLLAHEESLFFALFFVFILVMWLVRGGRDQAAFAAILSPPVLLAFLANQRRVGILALMVGTLIAGLLVYVLVQHRRKLIGTMTLLGAAVLPIYLVTQAGGDTLLAEPARAMVSIVQPAERDQSSNQYRAVETLNLQYNIRSNPIIGQGFGKPIIWYRPIPDLSELFVFWEYIPHNTLLWLWLRAGFLGFVAFWFMIGRFIVESAMVARSQRGDPYLQAIPILSIAAIFGWLAMAALDQGLVDFRSITIVGIFMGLVARLSAGCDAPEKPSPRPDTEIITSRE
jgi:hypothetical protein